MDVKGRLAGEYLDLMVGRLYTSLYVFFEYVRGLSGDMHGVMSPVLKFTPWNRMHIL